MVCKADKGLYEVSIEVVKLIPKYGRWKDVIDILAEFPNDNDLTETIYLLIENQLREDCVNLTEDKSVLESDRYNAIDTALAE